MKRGQSMVNYTFLFIKFIFAWVCVLFWFPVSAVWKKQKCFFPTHVWKSVLWSLRDREVACSASDCQGSNFESCVWRTVSSQSSHHPQEVLLAQFSLYVHKGGLKPDSFHFICVLFRGNRGTVCEKRLTFLYTSPCEYVQYNVWGP